MHRVCSRTTGSCLLLEDSEFCDSRIGIPDQFTLIPLFLGLALNQAVSLKQGKLS